VNGHTATKVLQYYVKSYSRGSVKLRTEPSARIVVADK